MTRGFKEIIEKEMDVLMRIERIMKEEKEAILNNDVGELSGLLVQLWELIARLNELEEERMRLVEEMSLLLGISPEDITISKMADLMEDEEIDVTIGRMRELVEGIRKANEENRRIIEWGMEYADFVLGILERIWGCNLEGYGASKGSPSQPLLLDHTA